MKKKNKCENYLLDIISIILIEFIIQFDHIVSL